MEAQQGSQGTVPPIGQLPELGEGELLQALSWALTMLTGPAFASTRKQMHLDFPLQMAVQAVPEGLPTSCWWW